MEKWQKWKAFKRDWSLWYEFVIDDIDEIDWEKLYTLKITSWDNEWLYSWIWESEIDDSLSFE